MPDDAPGAATPSARQLATITKVSKNFNVGTAADGTEYFVRATSMRDRNAWSQLQVGDSIEFTLRIAAGRSIISDVTVRGTS